MSKESYVRGFVKAAQAIGVDPVQLAKYAEDNASGPDLMYDPKSGKYRRMTGFEPGIAWNTPIPQIETGVSLKDTAKARAKRLASIREKAKKMDLEDVNPTINELQDFYDLAKRNRGKSYYKALADNMPEAWEGTMSGDSDLFGRDGYYNYGPDWMAREIAMGRSSRLGGTRTDNAMLKALYSAHTNMVDRVSKSKYDYPDKDYPYYRGL